MSRNDTTRGGQSGCAAPTTRSEGERRLALLVVPAPAFYDPKQRIDWIHDPVLGGDALDEDSGA